MRKTKGFVQKTKSVTLRNNKQGIPRFLRKRSKEGKNYLKELSKEASTHTFLDVIEDVVVDFIVKLLI